MIFIAIECKGRADTTEHVSAGGSCQAHAAMCHNPLVTTEAQRGVVSHNKGFSVNSLVLQSGTSHEEPNRLHFLSGESMGSFKNNDYHYCSNVICKAMTT